MGVVQTVHRAVQSMAAYGWSIAIAIVLVGSTALNVLQARRIDTLQAVVTELRGNGSLRVGTSVPDLSVHRLDGTAAEIAFDTDDRPTVIYFFSPTCTWCIKNLDNIRTLSGGVGSRFRFVGVSPMQEGVAEHVAEQRLPFPVFVKPSERTRREFKFGGTPGTLVISPQGVVLKNWQGAYTDSVLKEIEAYFGIDLPGIIVITAHNRRDPWG